MKIASVIGYSSYHNPFIEKCIVEAKKVSDEVIVVSYDHFFDGTPDTELKKELVTILLPFKEGHESRWYHNEARKLGYENAKKLGNFDAVFFIDSDEILEGDKVKLWVETIEPDTDHKLAHFWYYRDTCYRARTPEEGAVLVSTKTLNAPDMEWFGDRERENFSKHYNYMANYQNKVLGHHYSWAGTKEMLLKKVSSWGHNRDTDWKAMLDYEFSHEFNYTCPFKPYVFDKIEPFINFTFNE